MIKTIRHKLRVWKAKRREKKKEKTRSPKWRGVREAFLLEHGECAACGYKLELQVHHKQPYHLVPKLELDKANLITLCMGPAECHLRIGHGDHFEAYNPHVDDDAKAVRSNPFVRRSVEAAAKAGRMFE